MSQRAKSGKKKAPAKAAETLPLKIFGCICLLPLALYFVGYFDWHPLERDLTAQLFGGEQQALPTQPDVPPVATPPVEPVEAPPVQATLPPPVNMPVSIEDEPELPHRYFEVNGKSTGTVINRESLSQRLEDVRPKLALTSVKTYKWEVVNRKTPPDTVRSSLIGQWKYMEDGLQDWFEIVSVDRANIVGAWHSTKGEHRFSGNVDGGNISLAPHFHQGIMGKLLISDHLVPGIVQTNGELTALRVAPVCSQATLANPEYK